MHMRDMNMEILQVRRDQTKAKIEFHKEDDCKIIVH